jgi:hypothetical protein
MSIRYTPHSTHQPPLQTASSSPSSNAQCNERHELITPPNFTEWHLITPYHIRRGIPPRLTKWHDSPSPSPCTDSPTDSLTHSLRSFARSFLIPIHGMQILHPRTGTQTLLLITRRLLQIDRLRFRSPTLQKAEPISESGRAT